MKQRLYPLIFLAFLMLLWISASHLQLFRSDLFPYFSDFIKAAIEEFRSLRVLRDSLASLYRWGLGFSLALFTAIPLGLALGRHHALQRFLGLYLNLFRSLSPLAWIPFAVIWFGIGDAPVVFLIFLGCFFPLLFSTLAALKNIPKIYYQVARDYGFQGQALWLEILLPAILPQIISSLRLMAGLAWIVLVPAEMLAGSEGLGYAILDARNGLRTDLLVFNMIVVATIAHVIDLTMERLNRESKARWSYEQ